VVVEDFFTIVRVHNQGAAFGLGNGTPWAPVVFFVIALVALGALHHFWKRGAFDTLLLRLAAGLLTAGILGNLSDRILQGFVLPAYREEGFLSRLSQGYVVDFLDFQIGLYGKLVPDSEGHWPSFNVADSCICVAAFFLILSTFRSEAASKGDKEQAEA
jgi:signal peptidase II